MSKETEILKPKKNTTNSYKVKINNEVIPETIEKKPKKVREYSKDIESYFQLSDKKTFNNVNNWNQDVSDFYKFYTKVNTGKANFEELLKFNKAKRNLGITPFSLPRTD